MKDLFKKLFNYQPDDFTSRENIDGTPSPATAEECHYDVKWSEEDQAFVATVKEFPSMSWIEESPDKALAKLRDLVRATLKEMQEDENSF